MRYAWEYANRMANVQIRNVPDDEHRRLKARAAMAGQTLSDFALAALRRSLERPTLDELVERIASRGTIDPGADVTALVRAEREL